MFGLTTPITYNTDLSPIFSHYYMGFCGGNCPSYASLFNPAWIYRGGIGVGNPYISGYQCNNFYPNIFALNYAPQPFYYGSYGYPYFAMGGGSVIQYSRPVQTPKAVSVPKSNYSTNPIEKPKTAQTTAASFVNKSDSVNLGSEFVKTARKYSDCSEFDGTHHKFCVNSTCKIEDPLDQEWCTDFVTYVVKESYKKQGKTVPSGFGNHDVRTLKNWAINNGYFIRTSNKSQKGTFIKENIKQGDIIILNENDASHTGFVTEIDKDTGVIHTIEGNRDEMVKEHSYSPDYPDLSGFIRLTS